MMCERFDLSTAFSVQEAKVACHAEQAQGTTRSPVTAPPLKHLQRFIQPRCAPPPPMRTLARTRCYAMTPQAPESSAPMRKP